MQTTRPMNICCTVLGLYLLAAAAKLWHNVVAFLDNV